MALDLPAMLSETGALLIQMYDADALDGIHPVQWQGDGIYSCAGLGLAWCPWANCFMAMPCTSPDYNGDHNSQLTKPVVELFRITPDWNGGPWTIKRMPVSGAIGYTPTFSGKRLLLHPPATYTPDGHTIRGTITWEHVDGERGTR